MKGITYKKPEKTMNIKCIKDNKPCVWYEEHELSEKHYKMTCHLPQFMWILHDLRTFGGSTDYCNTYTALDIFDEPWIDWLLKKSKAGKKEII